MSVKKADVLVITPHPDDAEFGVAGTVAKWVAEGKEVVYAVCTNGDKGTSDYSLKPEALAVTREREQLCAAEVLGVREVIFLRHSDQSLEDTPEFRKEIVRLIRTFQPDIVVSSDPYRRYIWHRDHRIVGRVVLDAVFPYARDHLAYPDLLSEGLKPHKVKEVWLWTIADNINHRADITDTFQIKLKALRCHESQAGNDRLPDLEERLRQWAKDRAEGTEYELAEAFHREEILW
ncbi:N-acetyl-alpha-D-glucosaminyl L-malate deacetylase 1 [subsurface metagenome]